MKSRRSLVTNQLRRSAVHLIGRYAQRMLIENSIADGVDFFHMDALSSAVHEGVCFQKRAHNPLLLAAGFAKTDQPVPWLGNRRLHLLFG